MKLTPFKKILAMTKDKLQETMAPIRALKAKKQAELKKVEIDEKITRLESDVHEITAKEQIDFDGLIAKLDEIALLERRKKQFDKIIGELFPESDDAA